MQLRASPHICTSISVLLAISISIPISISHLHLYQVLRLHLEQYLHLRAYLICIYRYTRRALYMYVYIYIYTHISFAPGRAPWNGATLGSTSRRLTHRPPHTCQGQWLESRHCRGFSAAKTTGGPYDIPVCIYICIYLPIGATAFVYYKSLILYFDVRFLISFASYSPHYESSM